MALDSERRFSKGRVALGGAVASGFNKFDQDSSPKYHVGFKVEEADGSVYRYAHFGATVNRGVLVAGDLSETSQADLDNEVIAPADAVAVNGETVKPGALGSRYVEIDQDSITVNQFAGGKLITTDDTGEGYTYDIAGNTATNDPATGNFRLELVQPLQVALDATTDIAIQANPYHNLEIATTTDIVVAGVSCATITAADNYGWIQTKGQVGILQDGTIAVGGIVALSDGVAGAVHALAGGGTGVTDVISEPLVGFCVDAGDNTGHGVFKINLE
jgi:hypothetical protein